MYTAPSFEEADRLTTEILDFLMECGGIYDKVTGERQAVILESIASGQYVLYRDEQGKISHWLCYWKVWPDDLDMLPFVKPCDTRFGTVLYILEHGNKEGRQGMTKMIKDLRERSKGMQGVMWNSKGRGIKAFMRQKGA